MRISDYSYKLAEDVHKNSENIFGNVVAMCHWHFARIEGES